MRMRIESGPARADRNWRLAQAVVFLGFASYFVYDGAIGYPAKNRAEADRMLNAPQPFGGTVKWEDLPEHPTQADFAALEETRPTSREQLAPLGEPNFTQDSDLYFISRYGYAKVSVTQGQINPAELTWRAWGKTREEIHAQYYWAVLPGLIGLYFLFKMFRAMALRVVVDDEGLMYDRLRVPFERMVSLRDYNPKGWIDLYYKHGGQERKLRLDHEKIGRFDAVVEALCAAKGFKNELAEYAVEKQRQHEAEEAAAAAEDSANAETPSGDDEQ